MMNPSGPLPKRIDLWKDNHWFALHTKTRREPFAAANVSGLGLDVLLPRLKIDRLSRHASTITTKPLFPGYFFARFSPENSLPSVKCAKGVLRVLSSGNFPIPIDDEVIHAIRARVLSDGYFQLPVKPLTPGDRVSILDGPFEGFMGRVEREFDDGRRVTIFLEAMQQARVSIEKRWLQLNPG
jgi:transcriptional antiterminator RfaH